MFYYLTIGLTIISNVLYHLILKLTPANVNPVLSLAITYATAMMATLIIYPFYSNQQTLLDNVKSLNWASFALGLAIVGLELGFLLAYRLGWEISFAGIVSNIAVALILIPLGILFFQETVSAVNAVGLLFCLIGLLLVNYKV